MTFVDRYSFDPDEGPMTLDELAEEAAWLEQEREIDEGEEEVVTDGRFL
jgi:hypothetical protein